MEKTSELKLTKTPFQSLPLGTVKPMGWLQNQLKIQADGFTGHLDEHWDDVGPNNGWLGGNGDSWERGPYYLDGLVPLAFLLEDEKLIDKVKVWIEATLDSQREDGSFGPSNLRQNNKTVADQDWWQEMIMLKVLTQYEEATNDKRIVPFMQKYFQYLLKALPKYPLKEWAQARGADLLLSIHWLYERTDDPKLLELIDIVEKQTIDWTGIFSNFPYWRKQNEWDHRIHVVNVAMGIKTPAMLYRSSKSEYQKQAIYKGIESLMTYHGQAHGMFSGDEWLSGTHPSQGVELCAVVEYMFSMENLVRVIGDGKFGDILEKVAFNALPATISPAWDSHQYDQQVNQVICNSANRPWVNKPDSNTFGLEPNFGCCTSNMHQGWPKFTTSLWMSSEDNGLAVISYAPCQVEFTVSDNVKTRINVSSDYPFRDSVSMEVNLEKDATFSMYLRVPNWCKRFKVKVNGIDQTYEMSNNFAQITRTWSDNDVVEIGLPMSIELNERNNNAVSVQRGPLVYVLPLEEQWVKIRERERFHDWEIYPKCAWQYALIAEKEFDVKFEEIKTQPFNTDSPVRLLTQGKLLSNWIMENNSAAEPPFNPKLFPGTNEDTIELIPYGCARLRIGEFPILRN
ncbi:beta-L-arabinofuranosidase domain-containing protein [Aquibacillus albus]|uniref:DUF1680 family protein n=1 Tax=Aquibacillus albus TaxID=1168171 RepID=A0ABS2N3K4_9BACI|nr:beta-L-arabinofuranosidase domain-containing protein [Aquibacillus albus]MBM7572712.1 hypothetical protein [Aquibacillus albus]